MLSEITRDWNMSQDFESDWYPIIIDRINKINPLLKAVSLQIIWDNITGNLDGVVELYITNDLESQVLVKSVAIDSVSNIQDSYLIILYDEFKYIKIKYTKNNITQGKLTALIAYSEIN